MRKVILSVVVLCMMASLIFGTSACNKAAAQDKIVDDVPAVGDSSVVEDNGQDNVEVERPVTDEEPPVDDTTEVEDEDVVEPEQPIEDEYLDIDSSDAIMLAKLVYGESRGIYSVTEQACVIWTVLNRVDAGYASGTIYSVVTAPNQFYYSSSFPTTDDYGRDLVELATDVLSRWYREKAGEPDVGRVLPVDYFFYNGAQGHNWFRKEYRGDGTYWDYSLPSPYES